MRIALALAAFLVAAPAITQEMPPDLCRKLSASVSGAADASTGYLAGLIEADVSKLAPHSSGDLRSAVQRATAARERLIPAMKEHAQALEDLGYQLKVCARR